MWGEMVLAGYKELGTWYDFCLPIDFTANVMLVWNKHAHRLSCYDTFHSFSLFAIKIGGFFTQDSYLTYRASLDGFVPICAEVGQLFAQQRAVSFQPDSYTVVLIVERRSKQPTRGCGFKLGPSDNCTCSHEHDDLLGLLERCARLDELRQKRRQEASVQGTISANEGPEGRVKELSWASVFGALLELKTTVATRCAHLVWVNSLKKGCRNV